MDTDQMKEEELKALMKESRVSPSAGFADEVMHKIEMQQQPALRKNHTFLMACAACFLLFVLSFIVTLPEITWLDLSLRPPSFLLPVLSVIFIAYQLVLMLDWSGRMGR